MKTITCAATGGNPETSLPIVRFDGSQSNDARTTRLLAVLASVAGDYTGDRVAQQMIRSATSDLFNAAARLERLARCGQRSLGAAHV